jgi:hypothetical protein
MPFFSLLDDYNTKREITGIKEHMQRYFGITTVSLVARTTR